MSRRNSPIHGAFYRNHPRSTRWAVDADYLAKLSREELEWYAAFCNRHYGANFSTQPPDNFEEWEQAERRAAYVAKNVANGDWYTKIPEEHISELTDLEALQQILDREDMPYNRALAPRPRLVGGPLSAESTPEYLDSPEYKAARDKYRETLRADRRYRNPEDTPTHRRARNKLEKVVRRGTPPEE